MFIHSSSSSLCYFGPFVPKRVKETLPPKQQDEAQIRTILEHNIRFSNPNLFQYLMCVFSIYHYTSNNLQLLLMEVR